MGANDGVELCNIMYEYISDLLDELYSSQGELENDSEMRKAHNYLVDKLDAPEFADYTLENVNTIWGEILFRVTGYHNSSELLFASLILMTLHDSRSEHVNSIVQ